MSVLDLLISSSEKVQFEEVFLSELNHKLILQLSKELRYADELVKNKLPLTNKILFFGPSGCGKTISAKALSTSINKKIYVVNLSNIVSSKIGETSQNMKAIFDKAAKEKAILFLDEFDHIGKARGNDDNDVGEMRRLVNSVIQLIDLFPNDAILIAATNHPEIIDSALIRRFQMRLNFELPTKEQLDAFYLKLLENYHPSINSIEKKYGISYAEAKDFALQQMKANLIENMENKMKNR